MIKFYLLKDSLLFLKSMTGIFKGLSPFANETDKEIQIEAYAIDNLIEISLQIKC